VRSGPSRPATADGRRHDLLAALHRGPLEEQVADDGDEPRVDARRGGARDGQSEPLRGGHRLGVEVVGDLHVVGDEPDRHHHHRGRARGVQLLEVVVDVRLEPRDVRGAGARAVDELGLVPAARLLTHPFDDLLEDAAVLVDVRVALGPARRRHRLGQRVRDEREVRVLAHGLGEPRERGERGVDDGLDEPGVVEVVAQLVEHRCALEVGDRVEEVLAVLAAPGVRRVGARHEAGGPGDAVGRHLPQRVGEVGVPVAVAPVDRQVQPGAGEVVAQCGEERPVLVVDRRAAPEQEVVLADDLEPLARDPASPGDVLEERHHVLGPLGAAEGHQQDGVVGTRVRRHGLIVGTRR